MGIVPRGRNAIGWWVLPYLELGGDWLIQFRWKISCRAAPRSLHFPVHLILTSNKRLLAKCLMGRRPFWPTLESPFHCGLRQTVSLSSLSLIYLSLFTPLLSSHPSILSLSLHSLSSIPLIFTLLLSPPPSLFLFLSLHSLSHQYLSYSLISSLPLPPSYSSPLSPSLSLIFLSPHSLSSLSLFYLSLPSLSFLALHLFHLYLCPFPPLSLW